MDQNVIEGQRVSTDQKDGRGNKAPRQKGGRFGTSEAKKRRIAAGIEPERKRVKVVAGIAREIAEESPAMPELQRTHVAQAAATITEHGRELTRLVVDKVNQALKKNEGMRTLIDTVPAAATYVQDLVMGNIEGAPHDVRLRAALAVFEMSGTTLSHIDDSRDMSELTLAELERKLQTMDANPELKLSIPGQSVKVTDHSSREAIE